MTPSLGIATALMLAQGVAFLLVAHFAFNRRWLLAVASGAAAWWLSRYDTLMVMFTA